MTIAITTLVVEDDPALADAHRVYTERVAGFEVAAVVHRGADALRVLAAQPVDLVLLDFYLPDMNGLTVCRALRARGDGVDVIAVTSARDLAVVRQAVALGVTQYLLKPFSFAAFRRRLEGYAEYRRRTAAATRSPQQDDIDRAFAALHRPGGAALPKGLASATLTAVIGCLRTGAARSAAEIASLVGVSRPTARRYLDYLTAESLVVRTPRYGRTGRPEHLYRWSAAQRH